MSKALELLNKLDIASLLQTRQKRRRKNTHYGRLNRRMMAATIDWFFLIPFQPVFNWIAPIHQENLAAIQANPTDPQFNYFVLRELITSPEFIQSYITNLAVQLLVFCVLSGICWHFWSATPGKMLLRMKIVDNDSEQPITDRQIVIRLLGYWPSCCVFFLGVLWIGINKRKRAWHDIMAGTAVVTIPWRKKALATTEECEQHEITPH